MTTRTVLKGELATIAISTSQSSLSTPVGQVISIGDIETKVAEVSTTVMGDTAESSRADTAVDYGSTTITLQYNPDTHSTLDSYIGQEVCLQICLYDGAGTLVETWINTSVLVTSFKISNLKLKENVQAELGCKFNAAWQVTEGDD